jgi:hypothetical protein
VRPSDFYRSSYHQERFRKASLVDQLAALDCYAAVFAAPLPQDGIYVYHPVYGPPFNVTLLQRVVDLGLLGFHRFERSMEETPPPVAWLQVLAAAGVRFGKSLLPRALQTANRELVTYLMQHDPARAQREEQGGLQLALESEDLDFVIWFLQTFRPEL